MTRVCSIGRRQGIELSPCCLHGPVLVTLFFTQIPAWAPIKAPAQVIWGDSSRKGPWGCCPCLVTAELENSRFPSQPFCTYRSLSCHCGLYSPPCFPLLCAQLRSKVLGIDHCVTFVNLIQSRYQAGASGGTCVRQSTWR